MLTPRMPFKHGLLKNFHLIVRYTVSSYKNVGLLLLNFPENKICKIFSLRKSVG